MLSRARGAGKGCGRLREDPEEGRPCRGHLGARGVFRKSEEQMQRLEAGACATCSEDREEAGVAPGGGNERDRVSR